MTKKDFIIAGLLTVLAALLLFLNLGSTKVPESFWSVREGDRVVVEFESEQALTDAVIYFGFPDNLPASGCIISLELYDGSWRQTFKYDIISDGQDSYIWKSTFGDSAMEFDTQFVVIIAERGAPVINEIVFLNAAGIADISGAQISLASGNSTGYLNAFDEQETYQKSKSHLLEMYPQEREFVRAAYEKGSGTENASSPLALALISFGIKLFGMNPLGWRFMSALAGLFCVPIFYLLGKKLFNSSWLGAMFSALALINGVFLSVFRLAAPYAFSVTLTALAFYLLLCFYKTNLRKGERAHKLSVLYLSLSGAVFALSVAAERAAVFSVLALAGVFVIALLRDRDFLREQKTRFTSVSVAAAALSIVVSLLVFIFTSAPSKTASNGLLNTSAPLLFDASAQNTYYKIHLFGNTALYYFGLFAVIFALMFALLAFLRRENNVGETRKKLRLLWFVFLGLVTALLRFAAGGFYALQIFTTALTVFALREFVQAADAKLTAGKTALTKGKIFAGVILLLFLINFVLIFPLVEGYAIHENAAKLFTWLNGALG